jgi:hypothetical protein
MTALVYTALAALAAKESLTGFLAALPVTGRQCLALTPVARTRLLLDNVSNVSSSYNLPCRQLCGHTWLLCCCTRKLPHMYSQKRSLTLRQTCSAAFGGREV